jgi:hypothetical protein
VVSQVPKSEGPGATILCVWYAGRDLGHPPIAIPANRAYFGESSDAGRGFVVSQVPKSEGPGATTIPRYKP